MIRIGEIEIQLRNGRMEAKTLDNMFRRRVELGANCPPFVSAAILREVKEVYSLDGEEVNEPGLGQIRLLVTAAQEPPGKILQECQKVIVRLSLDAKEDQEIRFRQGTTGLRRARILRMSTEAQEQGGLLTYEDLAYRLLNCGVRTIVRDAEALRREGLDVPTRGQQQDMGPRQSHRAKAVELYLQGYESKEIAKRLYHALSSIENYVTTFGRIVLLMNKGYTDDEMAFLLRRSSALVAVYRKLHQQYVQKASARRRIEEILQRLDPKAAEGSLKKGAL
jgi:hypothetical protein